MLWCGAVIGRAINFRAIAGSTGSPLLTARRRMPAVQSPTRVALRRARAIPPSPRGFQHLQRGPDLFERKRHAFTQGDRSGVMIDPDGEQMHIRTMSRGKG